MTNGILEAGPSARILDAAMEAAEMGPWKYTFADSVCYLSPRAQALYGIDSAFFVRDDDAVRRLLHDGDGDAVATAWSRACDPTGDGRYLVEYRVRRLEGGWRWVSAWGLVEFEGDDEHRRPVSMTGASRDVTTHKQAEMLAEAQKRSLEMIVSGAPLAEVLTYLTRVVERQSGEQVVAAILFLDAEGRLRNGASPSLPADYVAAIDGLKADPLVGTCSAAAATRQVVITPDIESDPGWAAIKHLPLGLGLRAAWSQPIIARDGRVVGTFGTYFRTSRVPSPGEREAVEILSRTAALAIERAHVDQALRDSEQRLRDEDRRKNEFLAALSHELRNPLAPVRTALHLLQNEDDAESRGRLLQTMDRQVNQLVRLVDDLLEVSRVSRGAVDLRIELVDLASVIGLAVETSEPVIRAADHHLSIDLPDQPVSVEGDRVRLAQILSNLLNNAAKYTETGGRISLRARAQEHHVLISVQDTGSGIEPEQIPHLFELFARGAQSARQNREGLGVGLALARRLAELHGGALSGASAGVGLGSEFTLRLPLSATARVRTTAEPLRVSPAADTGVGARVLVVDDNADSAEMTSQLLQLAGCDVRCAYDGRSGLDAAAEMRPDVVLLDIGLPDLSGHDVCRQIRREPWSTNTMMVAVTGWGQKEDRVETGLAGFDAHFVKPVDPDSLISLLRQRLAGR